MDTIIQKESFGTSHLVVKRLKKEVILLIDVSHFTITHVNNHTTAALSPLHACLLCVCVCIYVLYYCAAYIICSCAIILSSNTMKIIFKFYMIILSCGYIAILRARATHRANGRATIAVYNLFMHNCCMSIGFDISII